MPARRAEARPRSRRSAQRDRIRRAAVLTKSASFSSALGWIGRRLHGRAGQREGARARLALALRLLVRLGRSGGGLGLREDGRLVLARKQPLELVAVDRLALDQDH